MYFSGEGQLRPSPERVLLVHDVDVPAEQMRRTADGEVSGMVFDEELPTEDTPQYRQTRRHHGRRTVARTVGARVLVADRHTRDVALAGLLGEPPTGAHQDAATKTRLGLPRQCAANLPRHASVPHNYLRTEANNNLSSIQ